MIDYERQQLLSAFEFPRQWFLNHLSGHNCQHGLFYNNLANDCRSCARKSGCQWLGQNDFFDTIAQRNNETLKIYLEQALGLIETETFSQQDHRNNCDCEVCSWMVECFRILYKRRIRAVLQERASI